ncbi:MAG: M48 family metallopeptidase [Pseudomonadales bacterium]|nr:M48 family metallopeptidase [Pseudomonadales bacterium]
MGQAKYSVISVGGSQRANEADNAREFLTEVKGMTPVQVQAVLEGVPTIIQQGVDGETATALAEAMGEIGLKCHVVEQNIQTKLETVHEEKPIVPKTELAGIAKDQAAPYRREDIVEGFSDDVQTLTLSLSEKIQMSLLAVSMLVLPLLFLATIIGLMGGALILSENAIAWFKEPGPFPFLSWIGVFVILGFTSVLIHRAIGDWRREKKYVSLDRDRYPQLYTFVEKIAHLMGVKAPVSIKLDAEVGVVLRPKEFFSPISGYRSELIIGLPLFYSLNVRQLAGVITHAFSGFSQDACRYGYPVVSSINGWLYRCSNYTLDMTTLTFSKHKRVINPVSYAVLLPFDLMARVYFKLIYVLASALSFARSREMDMQADILSAQISGSNEFRSTQFRLRALHYGQLHARSENLKRMNTGSVVPNYSAFVVDYAEALRIELKPTLINEMEQLVTPLTRSRVVDLGRIVNVEKHQFEGSCYLLGPAVDLLAGVESLSREVTRKHYESIGFIEERSSSHVDQPQEEAAAPRIYENQNYTFMGWQNSGRYLRFDEFHSYDDLGVPAKSQDLRDLVSKLSATEDQLSSMATRYRKTDDRAMQLHVSKTLQEVGIDSANKNLIDGGQGLRQTETSWLKTLNQQGVLRGDLTYYEALISQRISLALSLAKDTPEIRDSFQVRDFDEYIDYLKDSVSFMYKAYESVARLRTYTYTLGALVNAGQLEQHEDLRNYFDRYHNYCSVELNSILNVLSAVAYPLSLPHGMKDRLEQPSIAEVLRFSVKGIDHEQKSVSLCFKVCHSSLKFLDVFAQDLMTEIDKLVYQTESHYGISRTA